MGDRQQRYGECSERLEAAQRHESIVGVPCQTENNIGQADAYLELPLVVKEDVYQGERCHDDEIDEQQRMGCKLALHEDANIVDRCCSAQRIARQFANRQTEANDESGQRQEQENGLLTLYHLKAPYKSSSLVSSFP